MSTEPTRRAVVIGGLAATIGGGAFWLLRERRSRHLLVAASALAAESDLASAPPELGRRYLELHAEEADAERLAELLFAGGGRDVEALRRRLAETIADDWRSLDTVQLDGWIVARSEGRFLALLLLLADSDAA